MGATTWKWGQTYLGHKAGAPAKETQFWQSHEGIPPPHQWKANRNPPSQAGSGLSPGSSGAPAAWRPCSPKGSHRGRLGRAAGSRGFGLEVTEETVPSPGPPAASSLLELPPCRRDGSPLRPQSAVPRLPSTAPRPPPQAPRWATKLPRRRPRRFPGWAKGGGPARRSARAPSSAAKRWRRAPRPTRRQRRPGRASREDGHRPGGESGGQSPAGQASAEHSGGGLPA